MKRTFVMQDGKVQKFWSIETSGANFTVTFGRLGTNGQSSQKAFDDENQCNKEAEKLIAEKIKKGYKEIDSNDLLPDIDTQAVEKAKAEESNYLQFSDFNFKLAVIEELMYKQKVLKPEFDVFEYIAENLENLRDTYTKEMKKAIKEYLEDGDVEFANTLQQQLDDPDEYNEDNVQEALRYSPIKQVIDIFKGLKIDKKYGELIETLQEDFNAVGQIWIDWDGECDYFDIKKMTDKDLKQFPNLKKIHSPSTKYDEVADVLMRNGIELIN